MSEFDLINTYFNWRQDDTAVSVHTGDDAAVIQLANNEELVVSVDTSIRGVHFPADTPAHAVGYKSLAVNLSDMAAMGAVPRWFTLALTLPEADAVWLGEFALGLRELAEQHGVTLVGGDTTRGPLSITIQIMGTVDQGKALQRSGAQIGDLICITGTPGDAAAGLACLQQRLTMRAAAQKYCGQRLNYPTPRIAFGSRLSELANSCIDVSDGLLADLQHMLDQSACGAQLAESQLPFSAALETLARPEKTQFALSGGDDYELLFTIAPENLTTVQAIAADTQTPVTMIGRITERAKIEPDTIILDRANPDSAKLPTADNNKTFRGFNHFAD